MVKQLRISISLLLLSFSALHAQNLTVKASTDSINYKVGDYIKYTLEFRADKNVNFELPPVKDSIKVLDFIQALPVDSSQSDSKIVKKYTYIFSKYDSSQVTIPSLKVFYTAGNDTSRQMLASNPITIMVNTLPVSTKEDIKDVKDPLKLPLNWLLIGLIAVAVLLLITAAYFIYRKYKKKKNGKDDSVAAIKIPPHELALNQLMELESRKLWQQGEVKRYHSEITEIVRNYFELRFNFRALEITSAEILAVLNHIEESKKIIQIADSFFSNADLVKFAKFEPMPKVNEEMMKQAYEIVNETILVPEQINPGEEINVQ